MSNFRVNEAATVEEGTDLLEELQQLAARRVRELLRRGGRGHGAVITIKGTATARKISEELADMWVMSGLATSGDCRGHRYGRSGLRKQTGQLVTNAIISEQGPLAAKAAEEYRIACKKIDREGHGCRSSEALACRKRQKEAALGEVVQKYLGPVRAWGRGVEPAFLVDGLDPYLEADAAEAEKDAERLAEVAAKDRFRKEWVRTVAEAEAAARAPITFTHSIYNVSDELLNEFETIG